MWSVEPLNEMVAQELRRLPEDVRVRLTTISGMLERIGPDVGMPHVRPLGRKLWEMRLRGHKGDWRAIYVAAENRRFVVLLVFAKKTRKTPKRELDLALKRWRETR